MNFRPGPPRPDDVPGLAPRRAALHALLVWERDGFPVADTLSRDRRMDRRDHALALQIATTAVRWKLLLDHHLNPFLRSGTAEDLMWVLRLSLAQAHRLERIPFHAAVDLGVRLAREVAGKGAGGFANAVLRRAVHHPLQIPDGTDARSLSIAHSHPLWLVERWLDRHGLEGALAALEAGNREPAPWTRVRPGTAELPWSPEQILSTAHDGLFVLPDLPRDPLLDSDAFARGDLSFQDPSSGEVALSLAPHLKPGSILVDLCSAPGGKISCLRDAGALEGVKIAAFDRSPHRQRRTRDGFRQKGIRALVAAADGTRPPLKPGRADAVLLDAPCSNLGVLSRRPEARWRATPDGVRAHADLQRALLESALETVRPGGVIAYSVCSTEPEEADEVVSVLAGRAEILERSLRLPGEQGWDGFFRVVARRPTA